MSQPKDFCTCCPNGDYPDGLEAEIQSLTARLEAAEKEVAALRLQATNDQLAAESVISEQAAQIEALTVDAERYRWLRDPEQDVAFVLDKVVGESPADEFGGGGYRRYEYRAGEELDAAIDAARGVKP